MAAMECLGQRASVRAKIPKLNGGMDNVRELIRIMEKSLVNEIIDAHTEDACASPSCSAPATSQRTCSRANRASTKIASEMVTCGVPWMRVEGGAASLPKRNSASRETNCSSTRDQSAPLGNNPRVGLLQFPHAAIARMLTQGGVSWRTG